MKAQRDNQLSRTDVVEESDLALVVVVKGTASSPIPISGTVTVGAVTVNNAAGAAAVNIQDGGNSITVDGPLTNAQLIAANVTTTDSRNLPEQPGADAVGRIRVSQPTTVFDSKQLYTNQPLYWDDAEVSGSGTSSTFSANRASSMLAVSSNIAGVRVRQTLEWLNYQPGKSQFVSMTFRLGSPASGITRRVGIFETNNGLFLEQISTGLGVVTRSFVSGAAVDTRVARADWNIDTMDGSGPSGITLDETKVQLLVIDFLWQGVGSVRFGFSINGRIYYVHQTHHANVDFNVYMSSPNLPLRYELRNDGTGPASLLETICSSVVSEGGRAASSTDFTIDRGATPLVTLNNASIYPVLSIRLKAGRGGTLVVPTYMTMLCTSTSAFRWALLLNPTIVGTALAFSDVNADSNVEADAGSLNGTTVTGGVQILSGYNQTQQSGVVAIQASPALQLGTKLDGTRNFLVLAVQRLTGGAETFYAALGWQEIQ